MFAENVVKKLKGAEEQLKTYHIKYASKEAKTNGMEHYQRNSCNTSLN